jgi:hypothetical protein
MYEDHPLIRHIRELGVARTDSRYPNAALLVQTEIEAVDILTTCSVLHKENEHLKAIVDLIELKNERDMLKARVDRLEAERGQA